MFSSNRNRLMKLGAPLGVLVPPGGPPAAPGNSWKSIEIPDKSPKHQGAAPFDIFVFSGAQKKARISKGMHTLGKGFASHDGRTK